MFNLQLNALQRSVHCLFPQLFAEMLRCGAKDYCLQLCASMIQRLCKTWRI